MTNVEEKFILAKKNLEQALSVDKKKIDFVNNSFDLIDKTFKSGRKVLWCGNGGSAAMASHFSAEFVGRFKNNTRKALNSISLTSEVSCITAIANDFDYSEIFSRQLEGLSKKGDLLIVLSTSGNSINILNVLETSNKLGIRSIAFLGNDGGLCKDKASLEIVINSYDTTTIQEAHLFLGHLICGLIDNHYS